MLSHLIFITLLSKMILDGQTDRVGGFGLRLFSREENAQEDEYMRASEFTKIRIRKDKSLFRSEYPVREWEKGWVSMCNCLRGAFSRISCSLLISQEHLHCAQSYIKVTICQAHLLLIHRKGSFSLSGMNGFYIKDLFLSYPGFDQC